jgi:hypothetical protein
LADGMISEENIAPDIGPFQFYIDAFDELSSCRVNSMSIGPIPFTAIVEYSKIFEVDDFNEFHYFIRLMDQEFLELASQKMKNNSGNKK